MRLLAGHSGPARSYPVLGTQSCPARRQFVLPAEGRWPLLPRLSVSVTRHPGPARPDPGRREQGRGPLDFRRRRPLDRRPLGEPVRGALPLRHGQGQAVGMDRRGAVPIAGRAKLIPRDRHLGSRHSFHPARPPPRMAAAGFAACTAGSEFPASGVRGAERPGDERGRSRRGAGGRAFCPARAVGPRGVSQGRAGLPERLGRARQGLAAQVLQAGHRRGAVRPDAGHREGHRLAAVADRAAVRRHRVAPAHTLRATGANQRRHRGRSDQTRG